jgi:DNA-directed RNA polymerase subunit RPC12/RpoP
LAAQPATAGAWAMHDRVDDPPIVRCPGCDQPMEAKERTPVMDRLVEVRYVCAGCGMETKRTIADEAR